MDVAMRRRGIVQACLLAAFAKHFGVYEDLSRKSLIRRATFTTGLTVTKLAKVLCSTAFRFGRWEVGLQQTALAYNLGNLLRRASGGRWESLSSRMAAV